MPARPPRIAEASFFYISRAAKRGGESMDRDWMRAVRERQDEVREEIARHRLGVALRVRRAPRGWALNRWRRALGRIVVGLGRAIEGDEPAERASLPCN
jgi:hypothetical protein